mmetsp:Transcript_76515/g.214672  ORF Transcript_76515/g.214672 Transcript_76515/m.214672 type:complete len:308 (-) Transcript_76515:526-1449(-)
MACKTHHGQRQADPRLRHQGVPCAGHHLRRLFLGADQRRHGGLRRRAEPPGGERVHRVHVVEGRLPRGHPAGHPEPLGPGHPHPRELAPARVPTPRGGATPAPPQGLQRRHPVVARRRQGARGDAPRDLHRRRLHRGERGGRLLARAPAVHRRRQHRPRERLPQRRQCVGPVPRRDPYDAVLRQDEPNLARGRDLHLLDATPRRVHLGREGRGGVVAHQALREGLVARVDSHARVLLRLHALVPLRVGRDPRLPGGDLPQLFHADHGRPADAAGHFEPHGARVDVRRRDLLLDLHLEHLHRRHRPAV